MVLEMDFNLRRDVLRAAIPVEMPSNDATATGESIAVCSIMETATEGTAADGGSENQAHGVGLSPPFSFGALVIDLDSNVELETGFDLCEAAVQEVVTVQRLSIQVTASNVMSMTDSSVPGVTEGVAVDVSTDVLAHYTSTALMCGFRALTLGLDSTEMSKTGCVLGQSRPDEVLAVERLLTEVAATGLSVLFSSVEFTRAWLYGRQRCPGSLCGNIICADRTSRSRYLGPTRAGTPHQAPSQSRVNAILSSVGFYYKRLQLWRPELLQIESMGA